MRVIIFVTQRQLMSLTEISKQLSATVVGKTSGFDNVMLFTYFADTHFRVSDCHHGENNTNRLRCSEVRVARFSTTKYGRFLSVDPPNVSIYNSVHVAIRTQIPHKQ